jgi:hypothetical protein
MQAVTLTVTPVLDTSQYASGDRLGLDRDAYGRS